MHKKEQLQLTLKSISKTYNNQIKALQNINLNIEAGIFGLLGPNGAGKSSLMRTIVGLQDPDEGGIYFNKIDIFSNLDSFRKVVGYLPQNFGFYPNVTAKNLLDHFAKLKGFSHKNERDEMIESLLIHTNLWSKRNALLGSFSGGMKQRLGLAQSLIGNPKVLIIDEPTAGLDPEERYRLLSLLAQISCETIILLSTHIVQDVADLCSRFAIINSGELIMVGNPTKAVDSINGKIWFSISEKNIPQDCKLISKRLIAGVLHVFVFSENQPMGFNAVKPTLEDFYFSKIT